ncbi:hypothetical protein RHAL1_01727 [Beijerinckiaceae bacterium RH AL1]|nr:type II toxin-antitoxin system HicB family antitoxin [Beijerinckiaceae bacterium]VVB45360.1 hypothetical protein RHCH11_RHCH11_01690 [Beijerinckiaceae bacterium RH CH11]VVB45438.1 hypothetical protein RHAL8_01686 [Beijerinckiaceae bacterium RH AL8]VVC54826.1 hypothetical protein RHAL1_01727 [Beijerinckiaceae bacterium RH AL1]
MMQSYPIRLTPDDNGTLLATAPDIPEVATFGDDAAYAAAHAADAIVTALRGRIARREPVPPPSPVGDGPSAVLATSDALKIALYEAMRADGIGKAELARRLQCHLPQIDRLLDLNHESKLEALETALRAVGRAIDVSVILAA